MVNRSGGRSVTVRGIPAESPEEFAAEQVSIYGHRFCFRRGGAGPVLLLLHGIGDSSRNWVPAMRVLQRSYTVLAPDLPGHGSSSNPLGDYSLGSHASSMRDLLDLLSIERVTVVGQSFGGGVAMQFAYQFPGRCERLVLVDAGGLGREVTWILRLATVPAAEYVMPVLFPGFAGRWGDPVARFLRERGIGTARAAEVWRSYRTLTDRGNRAAFVRTARAVIDPGGQSVCAVNRLYLVAQMPVLIVWGDQDKIIPLGHAVRAHQTIPASRLEVMQGAGHAPHVEHPARFARILDDFVSSTEPYWFDPEQMRDLLRRNASAP
jgi:pimeloyl-ACP methyl ester carboxylesterase